MPRTTVLVPDPHPILQPYAEERAVATQAGVEFILGETHPPRIEDAEVLITGRAISRDVIRRLTRCELIIRHSIGYDAIDIAAATEHGIIVANCPTYCVPEVSDHTCALILSLMRRVPWLTNQVHAGEWRSLQPQFANVRRLRDATLGLIGLGRIGREVARKMRGFECRTLAHDPYVKPDMANTLGVELVSLETLLRQADIVSLHVNLTPETHHLLNEERLAWLKPTAMIVNTCRGAVIDETALVAALRANQLYGVALDVLATEPPASDHPLRGMDPRRVILTPHFSSQSEQVVAAVHREAAETLGEFLAGRWPRAAVNPEVKPKRPLARDRGF